MTDIYHDALQFLEGSSAFDPAVGVLWAWALIVPKKAYTCSLPRVGGFHWLPLEDS